MPSHLSWGWSPYPKTTIISSLSRLASPWGLSPNLGFIFELSPFACTILSLLLILEQTMHLILSNLPSHSGSCSYQEYFVAHVFWNLHPNPTRLENKSNKTTNNKTIHGTNKITKKTMKTTMKTTIGKSINMTSNKSIKKIIKTTMKKITKMSIKTTKKKNIRKSIKTTNNKNVKTSRIKNIKTTKK